jgi:hypothetical protein
VGAFNQRLKFGPRDIRVDVIAGAGGCEPTIVAGDDTLAADDSGDPGHVRAMSSSAIIFRDTAMSSRLRR